MIAVAAPVGGVLVGYDVAAGDSVRAGQPIATVEVMKMHHAVTALAAGTVAALLLAPGAVVEAGEPLLTIAPGGDAVHAEAAAAPRTDLAALAARHAETLDAARPAAVAKRRATGHRTARENLADLCDPGSFREYGQLALAAQRQRRTPEELRALSPADGLVCGTATIAGRPAAVLAYDFTVLAGTQGAFNHKKSDRLLEVAAAQRLPVVWYVEGGGGRPGDTDMSVVTVAGLNVPTFAAFGRLSGLVPRVAIAAGRCFAGNAALFGCADVTIATRDATIGMGGPAMIEGGGLGVVDADEVGPAPLLAELGVIDLLVDDEAAATAAAKRFLGYFDPVPRPFDAADQTPLRDAVPEARQRVYAIAPVLERLFDTGSVQCLRELYAPGMITGLARLAGRPLGFIANDPAHLGGAVDAPGADKAARFIQLCDAFDLPLVSLIDTPGFMVGPAHERLAAVRRVCRLFVGAANADVPVFAVVLRKGYGLGAMAMALGGLHRPLATIAWPTAEFGAMGVEGGVRLAWRRDLAAFDDPAAREAFFAAKVAATVAHGAAASMAEFLEIDAVIDPVDTRDWLIAGLAAAPPPPPRAGKKRAFVDTW